MGSSSKKVTIGYKIYLGLQFIWCRGPIDSVRRFRVDEKNIFDGRNIGTRITVDNENLFGGKKQEGGVSGSFDVEFGEPTQTKNDYLVSKLGANIPAYRGVVSTVLRQMYLGTQPYIKKWDARFQRILLRQDGANQWYSSKAAIPDSQSGLTIVDTQAEWLGTSACPNVDGTGGTSVYTITGANVGDTLTITPEFRSSTPYNGFSYLPSDSGPEAYWAYTTSVYYNGAREEFWETRYPTKLEAYEEAAAAPIVVSGATSYTIFIYDPVPANNRDGIALNIVLRASDYDMNPAHIIRECLTDPDWGMGYPEDDIDDDEFRRAADALYDEGLGLSFVWDRQKPIDEFVADVLEHIDAALYVSKSTGRFVLKLIRADYNETGLTILDENSIERVDDFSRVAFGELVNSVSVVFYNRSISKQDSVAIQNTALYQQQGALIETTRQYPGITNKNLASRVAERDLNALSTALISCTIIADRTAANINIGDAFILDWPDYGINSMVMRCQSISYGDGRTNKIKIKCTQDVFDTPASAYLGDVPETSTSLIEDAVAASPRLVIEAPYYFLVRNLGESEANSILSNNNYSGYLLAAGGRAGQGHLNAELWVDDGGGTYADEGTLDFCPWAMPAPESDSYMLDKTTTFILLDEGFDLDQLTIPTYCQMGDEIMRVDALSENSAGRWEMTVGRGCLDTTPQEHTIDSSGQYIYFWEELNGYANTEFNEGETASAKILTSTLTDQLLLAESPSDSLLFRRRAYLPYPPGNLRINGELYPSFVTADSGDNVLVEWAHRDRLQQTGSTIYDHTEGDIGPEAGVSYTVRLYNDAGGIESEQTSISGTSASVDMAPLITATARIDVVAVRGGIESWMPASHTFIWNFVDSGLSDSNGSADSGAGAGAGDPYFSSVTLLLHMDGADASTTFTDDSSKAHTVTVTGDTQIDTAESKFGGASGLWDNSGDYLSIPYVAADFDWDAEDYTIELWCYATSYSGWESANGAPVAIGQQDPTGNTAYWAFGPNNSGKLEFYYYNGSVQQIVSTGTVPTNQWAHVAMSFDFSTGEIKLFIDGVEDGGATASGTPQFGSDDLVIGQGRSQTIDGWLDDVRITKGVARYTGDFTPPTSAHPDN